MSITKWIRRSLGTKEDPYPILWFGPFFTNYGWGWNFRWFGGWVVWVRRERKLYWSPDATPNHPRSRGLLNMKRRCGFPIHMTGEPCARRMPCPNHGGPVEA